MKNKIKILFVTQEYSKTSTGGAGVYAYELVNSMSSNGVEVHVMAPAGKTYDEVVHENLIVHWVKVISLPLLTVPIYHAQVFFRSRKLIKKYAIDSAHSNNNAGVFIPKRIPFIATLHHPVKDEFKHATIMQRLVYLPDLIFEKILLLRAWLILTDSHLVYELLLPRVSKTKLQLAPCGIDLKVFKPVKDTSVLKKKLKIESSEKIIFFPGGARAKRKGALDLINALESLELNNYRVIASGLSRELGWVQELKNAIFEAKLNEKFIFVNEIDYGDLPLYYSLSDIVVYPSLFEGFGLPVLEALACGRPLVCTNTGEAPYIIKNRVNGIIVEVGASGKLAYELGELLAHKNISERLRSNARKSVKSYSWEYLGSDIVDSHKKLLGF